MCSYATKRYLAGDVIASSHPFVHIVYNKFKGKYCDYCIAGNSELKKCSKCHLMYYCDRNCQSLDWKLHKLECKIIVKHNDIIQENLIYSPKTLVFLRLLLIMENFKDSSTFKYDLHDGQHKCFNELMSHENKFKRNAILFGLVNKLRDLFNQIGINITIDQLCALIGRYNTNSLGLLGFLDNSAVMYDTSIGSALYIQLSVFNHSCLPNANYINNGTLMQIRAVKLIEPNEEITIPYINFEKPKAERQLLLRSYCFECRCIKCDTNSDKDFDYKNYRELCAQYLDERYLSEYDLLNGNAIINKSIIMRSVKLGEELLKLRKQLVQYYNMNYSYFMFYHSLWLFQSLSYNRDVNALNDIQSFIKLTEHHIKITHGINHKFYNIFQNILRKLL